MSENAVQEAPETATPVEPRKLSKADLKRQRIFQERMQRHIAAGKTPEQAYEAIQREDYERLPLDKKLEIMRRSFAQSLENISNDIAKLHDNQKDLADVMDVNFRAFEALLGTLGVSTEKMKEALKAAEAEVRGERDAQRAQKEQEVKSAKEQAEKEELAESVDQPGTPTVPEGATVFGG